MQLLRLVCWLRGHRDVTVYRPRHAYQFCDRCARTTAGWTLDTPAPGPVVLEDNVLPFRKSA